MGSRGRRFLALLLTTALLLPALPVRADEQPDQRETDAAPGFDDLLVTPEALEPGCEQPPCGPAEVVSAGSGGFVALTPALLAVPASLAPGVIEVPVAGVAGVPEAPEAGTIVLRLAVTGVQAPAELSVFPAGGERPAIPTLQVDEGRDEATLVLVELGASGAVSLLHAPRPVAATHRAAPGVPRVTGPVCPPDTATPTFSDVAASSVHAPGIGCAAHWGIAHGYDAQTYGPADAVRRDQMASFVARTLEAAGHTLPDAAHGFDDVGEQVHATSIGQLAAAGIVRGTTPSTYAPAGLVRRDQMASYLVRALEWADGITRSADDSPFTDIAGNAHQAAIEVAFDQGLTTGRTATTYAPHDDVRRDQMATFLTRLLAEHLIPPGGGPVIPDESGPPVGAALELLGWFPPEEQLRTVAPRRVLDTRTGAAADPLSAGQLLEVPVTGAPGLPPGDAAAVVLAVGTSASTDPTPVTVWAAGTDRPGSADLVAEPGRVRRALVIVAAGADGSVAVRHEVGHTHLTLDVLGWLPGDGAYHPLAPGELLDTRSDDGVRLAAASSLPIPVEARAGLPGDDEIGEQGLVHTLVLRLSAHDPPDGTDLRLHPTGQDVPGTPSLAAAGGATGTALTIVPVGDDGEVTVANHGPAVHVRVEVVGYFALPAVAAELVVPDTTVIPDEQQIVSIGADGLVVLEAGADPVAEGNHLVVGVTPDTPEGWLGEVTGITTDAAGRQRIQTTPALLEDVFPAGDLIVDLGASDYDVEEFSVSDPDVHGRTQITATARSSSGVSVAYTYEGEVEGSCDFTGLEARLGPTIDMAFRVRWRWMKAPLVTALATVGAEASVALDGVSVACDLDVDLLKARVSFAAGPVPVVVVFELGATLGLSAGLAGLDLAAGASAGIVIGVRDNRAYSAGYAEFEAPSFDELMLRARDLRAYAMVDAWLHLTVKLYSVIGPRISIGPFLEMVLTTNPARPWWWMDLGVAGRVELKLDLWFKKWSWKLLEAELPLADWVGLAACTTYGPGHPGMDAYAGPCRTPAPTARPNGEVRQFAGRFRLVSAGAPLATLSIAPLTPPGGVVGQAYPAQQLVASGLFSDGVVWRVVAGSLPPGLALDAASGVLSGTPIRRGTYAATVEAWYGPVPASATQPPHGPEPPPRITLDIEVVDLRACHLTVTDPGDDGGAGQLRAAMTAVEQGDTICLEIDPIAGYVPGEYDSAVVLAAGPLIVPAGRSFTLQDRSEPPAVLSGDDRFQILRLEPGAELTLVGVAIDRGSAVHGGGVQVESGARLRLTEGSVVRSCSSDLGGGVVLFGGSTSAQRARLEVDATSSIEQNHAGVGGGVYASYGEIRVDGGRIAHNSALSGGGIAMEENAPGTVLLTGGAQIAGNSAEYQGGGLDVVGTVTMRDTSSVHGNSTGDGESYRGLGGGMFVRHGSVVMREAATIRNNSAYLAGGGIAIGWMGTDVTVTLHNTATITGNSVEVTGGGGVYHGRDLDGQPVGTLTLNDDSCVCGNSNNDDIDPPW